MSDKKFREFWIGWCDNYDGWIAVEMEKYITPPYFHVIEYAALEDAQAEIGTLKDDNLRKENASLKQKLEMAVGQMDKLITAYEAQVPRPPKSVTFRLALRHAKETLAKIRGGE